MNVVVDDVDDAELVVSVRKEELDTLIVTELRVSSIEAGRPSISDETCEDDVKMVGACDERELPSVDEEDGWRMIQEELAIVIW